MTPRMQQNLTRYALWGSVSVAIAVLTALLTQLNGTGDLVWRPIIAAGIAATLGVLTMALSSMRLTRVGSEDIAADVDKLRGSGVHRKDMVVLPKDEAVSMVAGALSPSQVAQVADEIEARLRQTPADTTSVPDHIIGLIDRAETEGKR